MSDSSDDRNPLDRLAEEFVARYRAGERPSLTEYVARCPDLAGDIRELFPALVEMEQLKPVTGDQTGAFTPAAEPSDPLRVGEFRILRRVGFGGMGVVYEAVQESLGRHVALKLLPAEALADPKRLERFRREAKAAARLHHTNIVPVFGTGEADNRHYYAMQFIAGHPLDAVIAELRRLKEGSASRARPVSELAAALMTGSFRTNGEGEENSGLLRLPLAVAETPISGSSGSCSADTSLSSSLSGSLSDGGRPYWTAVARIGGQVADALAYAHAQGILHRDIKPSNLLLDLRGTVWVTDFGLAKANDADDLTRTGDVVGTLRYMAPERFDGPGDHRADVYALGLTLYELLTLRPAFLADTRPKLIEMVLHAAAPAPRRVRAAIPRDLETIVLKATARDPALRYPSAADLADDLRRYLEDRPIQARRATSAEQAWRWCRRNPVVASLLAAVLLVFAGGAAVASFFAIQADREADRATQSARAADTAASEAARERDEARRRLVRLYVSSGGRAQDSGDLPAALLWFQRAWQQDRSDPAADPSHRARIAGVLAEFPELLGACFHTTKVCDAQFSLDGQRVLARTYGNEAILWDYANSRPAIPPLRHAGRVRHVCWSADGTAIATASADGTAAVWDAQTGAKRFTLRHEAPLTWVAFHPRGDRVVTAAEDGTVRMWSAADGTQLRWTLPPLTPPSPLTAGGRGEGGRAGAIVEHLAFSSDGTRLILACRDDTVRLWSVDPPEPLSPALPYSCPDNVQRYEYNYHRWPKLAPDGKTVVTSKDKTIFIWSGGGADAARKITFNIAPLEIYFIPNSNRMLMTGSGGNAHVIRLTDGKTIALLPHPRNSNIGGVSPDGKWLITASSGGSVHVWDAATFKPAAPVLRCGDFCSALAFSPDSKRYLASSQDGTVRVWASGPREPEVRAYQFNCGRTNFLVWAPAEGVRRAYSPDGKCWIEWLKEGGVRFAPVAGVPPRPIPHPGVVTTGRFSNDGSRFVVAGGGVARAWDTRTGEPAGPDLPVTYPWQGGPVAFLEGQGLQPDNLSRDGSRLVTWDDPATLSVWDVLGGRRVFGPARHPNPGPVIFEAPPKSGWVSQAALSPDGRLLAVGIPSSGTLTVWEVDAGRVLHHQRRVRGYILNLAFSSDGRRVLMACSDQTARVYDALTGAPVGPPAHQMGIARGSDVDPDGRRLVLFDILSNGFRVLDAERGDRLLTMRLKAGLAPLHLWFSRDGQSINAVMGRKVATLPLPRFDVAFEHAAPLVRFLTGMEIDETDGIAYVDQFAFRKDVETYRRAYRAWKGLGTE